MNTKKLDRLTLKHQTMSSADQIHPHELKCLNAVYIHNNAHLKLLTCRPLGWRVAGKSYKLHYHSLEHTDV